MAVCQKFTVRLAPGVYGNFNAELLGREARVLDFYCKYMTYTAAIERFDLMKGACPTPSSAKVTINIDHNSNIKKILETK